MSRLSWALAELQARSQERDKINHLPSLVERIGPSTCAEVLPLVDCFFSDGKLDAIRAFAPLVTDPWACDPICDLLTFSSDKERARKAFDAAAQSRGPPPPAYPDMNPPLNPSPAVYPDLNPHAPSAPPPVVPSFGPSVVPTPPVVPAVPTYRQAVAKRGGPVERHVWKRWTEVFSERGIREDMLFAPRAHEGNLIKRGEHFSIPKMLGFGQPWNEVSPVARSHTIRSHVHSADVVYHLQRRCVLSMDGLLYYFALGIGQEWEKAKGAIIVEGAGVEMLQPEHSGTDGRPFCIRVDSPVTRKPNSSSQGDFILDCRSEQERQTWFNALRNVATARSPPYNEDASNNFNVRITQNGPEIHRMDTPYRNGYDPPPYSQPGPTYNPPPYSQPGYTPAPMPPHSSAPSHGQGRGLDVGTAAVAGVAAVAAGVVGAAIAHNVSHKHKHKHNNTIPQGPPPVIPAPVPSSQTHIPSHPKSAGEFYQIVSAKCSSVVDFTASWCGPCKRITPLFEKLCSEYPDLQFVKVDVDELDTVAKDFGIRSMPTFLLFRASAVVDKVKGANTAHLQAMVSRAAAHDKDAKPPIVPGGIFPTPQHQSQPQGPPPIVPGGIFPTPQQQSQPQGPPPIVPGGIFPTPQQQPMSGGFAPSVAPGIPMSGGFAPPVAPGVPMSGGGMSGGGMSGGGMSGGGVYGECELVSQIRAERHSNGKLAVIQSFFSRPYWQLNDSDFYGVFKALTHASDMKRAAEIIAQNMGRSYCAALAGALQAAPHSSVKMSIVEAFCPHTRDLHNVAMVFEELTMDSDKTKAAELFAERAPRPFYGSYEGSLTCSALAAAMATSRMGITKMKILEALAPRVSDKHMYALITAELSFAQHKRQAEQILRR